MIFEDAKHRSGSDAPLRRRKSGRGRQSGAPVRRRRRSSFQSASTLSAAVPDRSDRSTAAWLWVLGLLLLAAAGFAAFLQYHKGGAATLPGQAPSEQLLVFIDPILAPLETGVGGYDAESLGVVAGQIAAARSAVSLDDGEIYSIAGALLGLLQQAAEDRARHLQRLVDLGSPVLGLSDGGVPARADLSESSRRHHELAIAVSWQRNSGTYRNRVDELLVRLLRMESGRFRPGAVTIAAPQETNQ